ncbi:hypothetical protein CRENBAI_005793, partial [Crenichthys baileyi]
MYARDEGIYQSVFSISASVHVMMTVKCLHVAAEACWSSESLQAWLTQLQGTERKERLGTVSRGPGPPRKSNHTPHLQNPPVPRAHTRDGGGLGGKLPRHVFSQDAPRLVFKTNSDVLVCDWCKHIRHTKEYLDFGAGERRLQFCSAKCLNQYKMDIFYKETQAALPGALCNPGHGAGGEGKPECSGGVQLLTPESWGTPLTDLRRKAPSPAGHSGTSALVSSTSSATSPSETAAVCSPSSSTSAKIPTPRPHESPLPPPPVSLHPPVGVPSGSPPMVMTPRGPMPLPLFMEHQMMQQIRPPFFRPSAHPAGPNTPFKNPHLPGWPPPPQAPGPHQ